MTRTGTLGLAVLTTVLAVALSAPVHAAVSEFGSDISHRTANAYDDIGHDTTYWHELFAGAGGAAVPADGQVTRVRVKGIAQDNPDRRAPDPVPFIHFQTLRPQGNGDLRVELSSGGFYLPVGGDPATVTTYKPVNMCVRAGDLFGLNHWGGHEWRWGDHQGIPIQIFSDVSGSSTGVYGKDNGTNVGDVFPAGAQQRFQNRELLMRMELATGRNATRICPGGFKEDRWRGMTVEDNPPLSRGQLKLRLGCRGESNGDFCTGRVRLEHISSGTHLGAADFRIARDDSDPVSIAVTPEGVALLSDHGSLRARAIVDGRNRYEDPGRDHVEEITIRARGGSNLATNGSNRLNGTAGPDVVCGLNGDDVIRLGHGNDTGFGGPCNATARVAAAAKSDGDDKIWGARGKDKLYGGTGDDFIDGGGGNDLIVGGAGRDVLRGRGGDDKIVALDGKTDRVECGSGRRDRAYVDSSDKVTGCERKKVRK